MTNPLSRRAFLGRSALIGCSAAASPLLTPVSFASAPWETRLVVIILRGGMDGLDAVQPYGEPEFAQLRREFEIGPDQGAIDLDGFYAMHPALAPLLPLWEREELGFVHAVSTPYRDKRSHFDGQDLLEAGTVSMSGVRDGWLNRALQHLPGVEADTAYALGLDDMKLLRGSAPVANWSPEAEMTLSPQALRLAELVMEEDEAFHAALTEAQMLSDTQDDERLRGRVPAHIKLADYAAKRLRKDARVAAFSINGWDTHRQQARPIAAALTRLSDTILTLKETMRSQAWDRTAVIAMTEFGRTVRANGTRGTDHGTGGALVFAGGAIRGGRVLGDWPGLEEAALYERRDLMPTRDVRAHAAWLMRGATGLDQGVLERDVFPDLDMGSDPGLLI
ncbi:DUF1501 domain-containing protein [Thalassococcus sp. S3]|uniref:DUF1501 domain-containing protein n=1 Tax=Thalassococcus sp. S3 TaxID=2017482 RepID=UPI00102472CA|nr:DUF1501 domain-containing protein [Thalassococcus sp. S3]QBF30947.1 twin-arginine translocation pathway signal [Thalassococcus sp. S3]